MGNHMPASVKSYKCEISRGFNIANLGSIIGKQEILSRSRVICVVTLPFESLGPRFVA